MAYRFSLFGISTVGQVKMKEMPEFDFDFLVLLLERWGAPQEREGRHRFKPRKCL